MNIIEVAKAGSMESARGGLFPSLKISPFDSGLLGSKRQVLLVRKLLFSQFERCI